MVTTLKAIQTSQIFPSSEQPRENFDNEKIKELAESILSNGLINPITVRKEGSKFFIVAGERRWRAHKIAGLKTIDAFIKEYKNNFRFMVESSIENYQREDIKSDEKEKDIYNVWQQGIEDGEIKTYTDLGKIMGISRENITNIIRAKEDREKLKIAAIVSTRSLSDTQGLEEEDRRKLLKKVEKGIVQQKDIREIRKIIKASSEEVKDAFLDDKITIDQAERISKLKTETQRKKAIQEHKSLAIVDKGIERNVKRQTTAKEKREFDKRLVQASNWIASFRGSVVDTHRQIEKTIKILLVSTKFIPAMDETQLKKLNNELEDFIEILERGEQLATQIQEKI